VLLFYNNDGNESVMTSIMIILVMIVIIMLYKHTGGETAYPRGGYQVIPAKGNAVMTYVSNEMGPLIKLQINYILIRLGPASDI
jgi:hypothetical protein